MTNLPLVYIGMAAERLLRASELITANTNNPRIKEEKC
jgi:hypothetical protein